MVYASDENKMIMHLALVSRKGWAVFSYWIWWYYGVRLVAVFLLEQKSSTIQKSFLYSWARFYTWRTSVVWSTNGSNDRLSLRFCRLNLWFFCITVLLFKYFPFTFEWLIWWSSVLNKLPNDRFSYYGVFIFFDVDFLLDQTSRASLLFVVSMTYFEEAE